MVVGAEILYILTWLCACTDRSMSAAVRLVQIVRLDIVGPEGVLRLHPVECGILSLAVYRRSYKSSRKI